VVKGEPMKNKWDEAIRDAKAKLSAFAKHD
jgi:hypothetical protein